MPKILVTGAYGQLGQELQSLAKSNDFEWQFGDKDLLDITDLQAVIKLFESYQPDYCINAAAYTAVDKAEEEKDIAFLVNATGSQNLAIAAEKVGATLFQISTDFVFAGENTCPYTEDTPVKPLSVYGESKAEGERLVIQACRSSIVIRTSWLYNATGKNFMNTMLQLAESHPELKIVADQIGTPTFAGDLAAAILSIIKVLEQTENKEDYFGTYHYSNLGVASWYDFAKSIFELAGKDTKVTPIPTEGYPLPAKRPYYSVLDKRKIIETFQLEIPYWRESLKKCMQQVEQITRS